MSRRSIAAFDTSDRQDDDYRELVKAALYKPGKDGVQPKVDAKELHELTQSKRKLVVDEALEVCQIRDELHPSTSTARL